MRIIGCLRDGIGIALAMELARLHLHDTAIVTVDNFDYEEHKKRLQEQYKMKMQIKPLPIIETYSEPVLRPSKHRCYRKQKPRNNKMQRKSRRINRKTI
jgi:hypothetical protein